MFTRFFTSLEHLEDLRDSVRLVRRRTFSPEDREEFDARRQRLEERQIEAGSRKRRRSPSPSPAPPAPSPPPPPPLPPSTSPRPPTFGAVVLNNKPQLAYRGVIVRTDREEAKKYALRLSNLPCRTSTVSRHVYWTDCSIYLRCPAGAVVWLKAPDFVEWDREGYAFPYRTNDTNTVELFAIAHALELATKHVLKAKEASFAAFCAGTNECEVQPNQQVHVFTDSRGALQLLETGCSCGHDPVVWCQVCKCIKHYEELARLGAFVNLYLIPGHSQIPGNVEADRVAYQTACHMHTVAAEMPVQHSVEATMPPELTVIPELANSAYLAAAISQNRVQRFRRSMRRLARIRRALASGNAATAARATSVQTTPPVTISMHADGTTPATDGSRETMAGGALQKTSPGSTCTSAPVNPRPQATLTLPFRPAKPSTAPPPVPYFGWSLNKA